MAAALSDRPFGNFRQAIADPAYHFGRDDLLAKVERSPSQVYILLGGRRMGKTSLLYALKERLLHPQISPYQVLPVLIDLRREQPDSLENLFYRLTIRLREAMAQQVASHRPQRQKTVWGWLQRGFQWLRRLLQRLLRYFIGGKVSLGGIVELELTKPGKVKRLSREEFEQELLGAIAKLRQQNIEGLCFLCDGAEFIVRQDWANDTWSYFRWLKDMNTAIAPFLGLVLSGYRDLKDYQQRVGSPLLNIAEVEWLGPLPDAATRALIAHRSHTEHISLTREEVEAILTWGGGHPYLTQQTLNTIFDGRRSGQTGSCESLLHGSIRERDRDFSTWWDTDQRSYSFSATEQTVYEALRTQRQGTVETLAAPAQLSIGETADALEVLTGTGVVQRFSEEQYKIGSQLFEQWVLQERRKMK